MVDLGIAALAYSTAKAMGSSDKVQLALFEAGLVESNFTNHLTATDHDSLGYLQQRPSQGWPDPTNITTATRSFVSRAMTNEKKYPSYSAGRLAQSVQRSAYPDRYDQREKQARDLLAKVSGGSPPQNPTSGGAGTTFGVESIPVAGDLVSAVRGLSNSAKLIAADAGKVRQVADMLLRLSLPSNMMRGLAGVMGIMFIFLGILQLGREVRNG